MSIETRYLTVADIPALLRLWRAAELPIRSAGREHPERLRLEMKTYPNNFIGAFDGDVLVIAAA